MGPTRLAPGQRRRVRGHFPACTPQLTAPSGPCPAPNLISSRSPPSSERAQECFSSSSHLFYFIFLFIYYLHTQPRVGPAPALGPKEGSLVGWMGATRSSARSPLAFRFQLLGLLARRPSLLFSAAELVRSVDAPSLRCGAMRRSLCLLATPVYPGPSRRLNTGATPTRSTYPALLLL